VGEATKVPFDIDAALAAVAAAVRPFPPAAMFALAEEGWATPFQQLVACVISIRTYDEVSLPLSRDLFAAAPTPGAVAALGAPEIARLIRGSTFADRKAEQILAIAERVVAQHGGELPCDEATMRAFSGVGVKCTNLALGIACRRRGLPVRFAGEPGEGRERSADEGLTERRLIAVDVHVHRVTNRWGYVSAPTPEKTTGALGRVLPRRYDVEINRLLVPFGKHVCTGVRPKCSTCPVLAMCAQVGVTSHR
jgi:endonuclease-3